MQDDNKSIIDQNVIEIKLTCTVNSCTCLDQCIKFYVDASANPLEVLTPVTKALRIIKSVEDTINDRHIFDKAYKAMR